MPKYPHKYSANQWNGNNNIVFFNYQKWSDITRNFWNYSKVYTAYFFISKYSQRRHDIFPPLSNYSSCWNPLLYFVNSSESHDYWIGEGKDIRRSAYIWVSLPTHLGEDCKPWREECWAFRSHSIDKIKKKKKVMSILTDYIRMLTCPISASN